MSAFSLLRSAEEEKTLYPGVPRGLIAVLFYYDSREQLSNAFKTLVQARQGISWTVLPNNEELSSTVTQYLQPILNNSMVDRILELISAMDLTKEIDLLQKNRALGNPKHRSMVIEKFKSIKLLLAETLFCWAAQTPLKRDECLRLIAYLSKVELTETKDGSMDKVNLLLFLSLLYSIDCSYLLTVEDITESIGQFPITNDARFVPEIHKEIKEGSWASNGMLSVVQLAWSVSLSILRQIPLDNQIDREGLIDDDDVILDKCLKEKPFLFIEKCILVEDNMPLETFHAQRLHNLLTDFIHHMFERVKNLKNIADENARKIAANIREGLEPPSNLDQPYENLLNCLSALYKNGQCGELVEEYWYDHLYSSAPFKGQSQKQIALYRFVRLPGDFLPPSLFVPYLNFLSGIATSPRAAQSVFNFLRMNSQPAAQGSNLSWENFLNAFTQYYNNLRVQHPQSMHETVYQSSSRSSLRCISPQELQGLTTVLNLLRVIAENDESARIAICNNTAWSPIYVFVGLLSCSVPLSLKTCLIKTLSAFSKSSSLGGKIWQAIEGADLVPSHDGMPGYSNRGIKQDIEEVESRCEEFPLSQGFLELLLALVKAGIPYQPGNLSSAGFKPYLDLVKNQIFLPHDSRTYKYSGERWILSRKCMELFLQLLKDYQAPPQNLNQTETWNHPSHLLLLELVQDSRLIRQIFSVLHDGVQILEHYNPVPGQKDLEDTLIYLLELILSVYKLQRNVLSRENKGDVLYMGIDRLLMTMNPRSGSCDHLLNISLLLGHHVTLPNHAALTCHILSLIGSSPSGQNHLLPLLTTPASRGVSFRQNFVQLLDHANLDDEHIKASEMALNLLKSCLKLPAPNMAHFLLGFVDGYSIGNSELRSDLLEPGVRGFPRTALHAVLASLPSLPKELCSAAYNLIFILTSNPSTSAATLRYLSSHDFVHQSLSSLQTALIDNPSKLQSTGWVLRIAALDLRYHSSHQQRSQLRRLISLLVTGSDPDPDSHTEPLDVSVGWNGGPIHEGRGILLSLLEIAELTVDAPPPLQCQFLTRAPEILGLCEEIVGDIKLLNISLIHQMLYQLVQDPGSVTPIDPIDSEIQDVLDHALALNQARRMLASQKHYIESWRQLVEVVVAVSPAELTELPTHQAFLHTLTLELTRRLLDESALSELSSVLVSTLLLLVTTLRTLHVSKSFGKDSLNSTAQLPSSLQLILRGIIDCILRFKHSSQSVRASLYATLLNYLRIHADYSSNSILSDPNTSFLTAPKETIEEQFLRENYEALRDDLPQLVDILSYEASAGHIVCKLLSLTCLDAIAALERRASSPLSSDSPLISHLSFQGHLRVLLDGILTDDQNLINLISEGEQDLRPLYLWEARASLLTRLSLNPISARLLLQNGLLTKVSEMQIFRYSISSNTLDSELSETEIVDYSLNKIYGGAITGAIRICMAVLTALGPNDDSAVSQVLLFLSSNVDSIMDEMRVPSKTGISDMLSQLALLTSVVATASPPALYSDMRDPSALETATQTKRLRKQLLLLLPQFMPESRLGKFIEEMPQINEDGICVRENSRTSLLHIFTNCLVHARDLLLQDDIKSSDITLLFQPILDSGKSSYKGAKQLSIGTLLSALDQSSQEFLKSRSKREDAIKKLKEIETAHFDSLRQFVTPSLVVSASPSAVRKLAALYLESLVQEHTKQEELSVHAVEACMLLLYRHLEYYFNIASKMKNNNLSKNSIESELIISLTADQFSEFKNKVQASVEEVLPRIKQVETLYSSKTGHVPFLEGCITKIRWQIAS